MTLTVNGRVFTNLSELNIRREVRRTDINYNVQGDMLIDLVCRKYKIEASFGLMTKAELNELRELCGGIFTEVVFETEAGAVTRDFYVSNEPAAEVTVIDGVKMYSGVKLIFEER